jgi:hypothetical protein
MTNLGHDLVGVPRHTSVLRLVPLALVDDVLVNLIVGEKGVLRLEDLHV